MSTEAQRNAANGSGNMFTMSADLSEISPVAPIARNGYAPFAKSTPDTLVSTDPIVAPSFTDLDGNPIGGKNKALKKAFTNLWDATVQIPANWTVGYYITAAGVPMPMASFRISAFIPVVPGKRIYITTSETAPVIAGAYFTNQSTPYGSGPDFNGANVVPSGVYWLKLNIDSAWTTAPIVIQMGLTNTRGKAQFIGDSITWGFTNAGQVATPFPTVVGEAFDCDVVNSGVSASTLAVGTLAPTPPTGNNPFVGRLGDVDRSADLHFVLYGTNDAAMGIPLGEINDSANTTFYGAYNILLAYLFKVCPASRIIIATPNKYGASSYGSGNTVATQESFAEAVRLLGKKWCVPVVDLCGKGPVNLNIEAHSYCYGDVGNNAALHLNQQGYIRIGQYIQEEIAASIFPQA